jgi:hypothetical protein
MWSDAILHFTQAGEQGEVSLNATDHTVSAVSTAGRPLLCIAVRKHVTLRARKLKMRCALLSDAAAVCAKLKVLSKLAAIDS